MPIVLLMEKVSVIVKDHMAQQKILLLMKEQKQRTLVTNRIGIVGRNMILRKRYWDQREMIVSIVVKVFKRVLVEDSTPYCSVSLK